MINQLPEKQKMVMHLKDIEEYSIAEICEALKWNQMQ
jgi:RNA polymerase sigma-70 factor (ECF subfamily)